MNGYLYSELFKFFSANMEKNSGKKQKKEPSHTNKTKETVDVINNLKKEKGDSNQKSLKCKTSGSVHKQINEQNNENKKLEQDKTVTKEDLQKLCDQLSAFNLRIKTARDVIRLRDELPFILQNKLEEEAEELECLFKELQYAVSNVETIRNQREALHKEKLTFNNEIDRLKSDAIQEMEVIVSVYDSNMMERWETVKKSKSTQEVEHFLHEVKTKDDNVPEERQNNCGFIFPQRKGRLEAMKNLQTLATQKLTEVIKHEKNKEIGKPKKKKVNNEEREDIQSRSVRSVSVSADPSQLSLSFFLDSDAEESLDENGMSGVLYNLVCEQVLSLPPWTQPSHTPSDIMDID